MGKKHWDKPEPKQSCRKSSLVEEEALHWQKRNNAFYGIKVRIKTMKDSEN